MRNDVRILPISYVPRRLQARLWPRPRSLCVAAKKQSGTGLERSGLSLPHYEGLLGRLADLGLKAKGK